MYYSLPIALQNQGNSPYPQTYPERFTLWNTYTGNTNFTLDEKINVPDLLQPNKHYKCTYMVLLFSTMPSWHSMPCDKAYPATLICKTRVNAIQKTPIDLTPEYEYTQCKSKEIFVIDNCFGVKMGVTVVGKHSQLRIAVENYFINLFSFMTSQALQVYKLYMENHLGVGKSEYFVLTYVPHWSEFEYVRNVTIHRSTYKVLFRTEMFYIDSVEPHPPVTCGANQFRCNDGTCISHQNLCQWHNGCSLASCVCWVEGREVYDIRYCRNVCLPGACTCSKHNFQCAAGGCIQVSVVCDGEINCKDGSDEFCAIKRNSAASSTNRSATDILLVKGNTCLGFLCLSGQCISLRYVNDLMPDCSNPYPNDESLFLRLRFNNERFVCKDPLAIPCVAGLPICFSLGHLCLYDFDQYGITRWCRNGAHLGNCAAINCTNSYKCPGSYCVPFHRVCDGHRDCINGEDEEQCDEYICKNFLRCSGSRICVHPTHVCDGINHCPNADDEMLCDVMSCPFGCNCLAQSIICTSNSPNEFPVVTGDYVKHISVIQSYMPFPEVHNICKQNALLIVNLTRNEVTSICEALQENCKFRDTLIVLDLAWNRIAVLQPLCFYRLIALRWISLAHNPLVSVDRHVFEQSLVSYIDVRGTELKTLSMGSIQEMTNLKLFNIMDLQLHAIDIHIDIHSSDYVDLLFNDKRFCCIFTNDKHCRFINDLNQICRTLLPHRMFGYMLAITGIISIIFNVIALTGNIKAYQGRKLSKLISCLCVIDAALASYLPYLGITDIYHNNNFVFVADRWQRSHMCHLMDVVSSSCTMLSLCLSGLLIYLTSQGVVKIRFGVDDMWHKLFFAQIFVFIIITTTNVSLVVVQVILNDANINCNMMANPSTISWFVITYSVLMAMLMMIVMLVISFSAVRLINHVGQTRKNVKKVSGISSGTSDPRKGVFKLLIAIVIVKSVIILPYPLLQVVSILGLNIPGYAYQYVAVTFITLESFYNPTVFVFRPLMAQNM